MTGAPTLGGWERPVQELLDRVKLVDLVGRLAVWLDERPDDDPRTIFTDDVTADTPGGAAQGIERVAAQAQRDQGIDRSQHLLTNLVVDLDGDRASVRASLLAAFVERRDEPHDEPHDEPRLFGARYAFEARRTDRGWRLSRVELRPAWSVRARGSGPG